MKKALICGVLAVAAVASVGKICNKLESWYFTRPQAEGASPGWHGGFDLMDFNTFYLGDESQKEIFLTFDEGYENGYTEKILDVLKEKNVQAAFFVTKPYIKENVDLVRRMVDEGHIVGNHTVRHKSSPSLSVEEMQAEITGVEEYFKEMTGAEMPKFFRPPMGEYSQSVLRTVQDMGYATIFWSFAYMDWDRDKQPTPEIAHKKVVEGGLHNGAIWLLHAVSSANAAAMGDVIDSARAAGFEFRSLYQLVQPHWPPKIS